jgi:IS30 family transposase
VITLVERSSRFVLAPLPGRRTAELARMSPAEMIATLRLSLRRSITWDRGSDGQARPVQDRDQGAHLFL